MDLYERHGEVNPGMQGGGYAGALIGHTIDGKYRLDALLGLGGMGAVYRAVRLLIGDTVAVKILHPQQVADPSSAARFVREAQAAARLKHPNAVSIYDFGTTSDGTVYLVMELVEGESLRHIIKERGPLYPTVAVEVIRQAAAALDEAHAAGIVHRDIKPDNIIVHITANGLRVKVLDFGVAKLLDRAASNLTQTGSVMGTPHYMSPEQCMGEELDGRSDIYSLGIVLYEMLAGVVPFNSPTSTAVVVQHVTQPPPSMRAINMMITPSLEATVLRALEKRREARPQSAGALARELIAALSATAPEAHVARRDTSPVEIAAPTPFSGVAPVSGNLPTVMMTATPSHNRPAASINTSRASSLNIKRLVPLFIIAACFAALATGAVGWLVWTKLHDDDAARPTNEPSATNTPSDSAGSSTNSSAPNTPSPPAGMAYVAGGEFTMGDDAGDEYSRPAHRVTVGAFFIDLYEVTCAEYAQFVRATGRRPPPAWRDGFYPPGAARHPVTGVTWDDASDYAAWVGKRLPTETEWEYAARGTDGRRYPWGDGWQSELANAEAGERGQMANVGQYRGQSPFGLFDMVGNAWEWTASDLTAYPGGQLPDELIDDPKVIRGGSWNTIYAEATTTFRRGYPARQDARGNVDYDNTGFRCARDVAPRS